MTRDLPTFAVVDDRRQIAIVDPSGKRRSLTGADDLLWAAWGRNEPDDVHSWPTWSPDGRSVASFSIARDGRGSRVLVSDSTGTTAQEVAELGKRMPIYLRWALEGDALAVLSQGEDDLGLLLADPRGATTARDTVRGSPLYFTWLSGRRIAAFLGEPGGPVLTLLAPDGTRTKLPGVPGNFCAPVALDDDRIAYVAHHRQRVGILVGRTDGTGTRELEIVDGLVAIVASPDGRSLARAIAPDGSGTAYRDLRLLDVESGRTRKISDDECTAFFCLPDTDELLVARRHDRKGTFSFHRSGPDGLGAPLIELEVSRDLRFYLKFFEQYTPSHPIVDPAGRSLIVAGTKAGASSGARLYLVPLDGGEVEEVGEGVFGTFAPRAPGGEN
jgi:hypothetical protein